MPRTPICSLALLGFALCAASVAAQPTVVSTAEDQQTVSLTVYNQNFAVIREVRPLALQRGLNLVRFEDVAAQIDPTSLALKSLTDPDAVAVREQNYQYDLIGRTTLLDKAVGDRIQIRRTAFDGSVEVLEGVLLSQPGQGLVVRLDDGRVLLDPAGEVVLDALPDGLVSRPSLLWRLEAARGGTHQTEVSYLTNGITWKADYVAVINEAEDAVDLTGWVTLDNQSGATYRDAALQLMAGDVRRARDTPLNNGLRGYDLSEAAPPPPAFQEEAFFEYHLYTLDGTTTIGQRETKQMTLLSAAEVGVTRRLVFDPIRHRRYQVGPGGGGSTQEGKVNIMLELANTEANNMGMPLPKGNVRLYKADARANLQFLGEDLIDHTPRNEDLRLYVGDAFDVVGTRTVKEVRRISDTVYEHDVEVSIRNRKTKPATVYVVERGWGDWQIIEKSHDYTRIDANTVEFPVTVGADEEVVIAFTRR